MKKKQKMVNELSMKDLASIKLRQLVQMGNLQAITYVLEKQLSDVNYTFDIFDTKN